MPLSKLWDNDTLEELALPALTTLFGLQLLRVLVASFVWYLGDTVGVSSITLGLVALGTFALAFGAAAFRHAVGSRRALIGAVGGLGLVRWLEQLSTFPALDLGLAMLGTTLFTWFFPLFIARTRAVGEGKTRKFGRGFLLGIVFDTTVQGACGTLDLSWQPGWLALAIVTLLVAAQWWLLARRPHIPDAPSDMGLVDNLPLVAIGPLVFVLQVVFQNVARAAAVAGLAPPMAFGFIVFANAVGLAAALVPFVRERATVFAALAATAFLTALMAPPMLMVTSRDLAFFFGNLLLFPFTTLIFAGVGVQTERKGLWRTTLANGIGWMLFVLFTLLYYVSYDIPLGISNALLPPLAIVLVGLGVLGAWRTMPCLPAASDWTSATLAFLLLLVPVAWGVAWRAPGVVAGQGFPVRVMTYNLHNGFNTAGRLDLESLAQVIEREKAEVVGLQEVARGWYIDSSVDMLAWLSQRLRMPYVFGPTAERVWGNAILSRYPIKEWKHMPLPPRDLLLRRGFTWARIDVGGGEELLFIVTHYHHIEGDTAIRQQQSPVLVQFWNQRPRTVFVGDLNAKPDAPEIAILREAGLRDAFALIGSGSGLTWPSDKPNQRIDYIWVSPDLTVRNLGMPRSTASDHLGVVVTVETSKK